jgi:hypothetical protein
MENYKLVKLLSGETLVCSIQEDNFDLEVYDNKTISLYKPVLLNALKMPSTKGMVESFIFSPWGFFSSQEKFLVQMNHIIMIADLKDSIKEYYLDYISQTDEEAVIKSDDNGIVEEDEEIEDEDFEDFFNSITKKEEDEENESRDGKSRITYH